MIVVGMPVWCIQEAGEKASIHAGRKPRKCNNTNAYNLLALHHCPRVLHRPPAALLIYFTHSAEDKPAALLHLLRAVLPREQPTLVFVATRHHVEFLHSLLAAEGLETTYVYGSMDQVVDCAVECTGGCCGTWCSTFIPYHAIVQHSFRIMHLFSIHYHACSKEYHAFLDIHARHALESISCLAKYHHDRCTGRSQDQHCQVSLWQVPCHARHRRGSTRHRHPVAG